jgi:hypothetical protein
MSVLTRVTKPGGVYLGVGPDQNFTYISGIKPKMAFIFDIRRQNAIELLMYKAIFELSPTRADFVSRLFSIKSPDKVPATARANSLFLAFDGLKGDRAFYAKNLAELKENLAKHGFALSKEDLQKVEYIYDVFFRAGPEIDYKFESAFPAGMAPAPNYMQAMVDTDADKKAWSYLATEENYQVVRDLQMKNLIIPIVGDFGGPSAIRKVADYVRQRNGIVFCVLYFQRGVSTSVVQAHPSRPPAEKTRFNVFIKVRLRCRSIRRACLFGSSEQHSLAT